MAASCSGAMGATARRILKTAAPFLRQRPLAFEGPDFVHRQAMQIGPFSVTPYLVDHSAYDAYALLIEADGRRLFYSGDFRAHGRKRSLVEQLMASPPQDIAALLLEGTTLGRTNQEATLLSEDDLEDEFERVFKITSGLALVQRPARTLTAWCRSSAHASRQIEPWWWTFIPRRCSKQPATRKYRSPTGPRWHWPFRNDSGYRSRETDGSRRSLAIPRIGSTSGGTLPRIRISTRWFFAACGCLTLIEQIASPVPA